MSMLTQQMTDCKKCQHRKFYPNSSVDYCSRGLVSFPNSVACQQYTVAIVWPSNAQPVVQRAAEGRTVSADEKATVLRYWKLP